MKAVIVLALKEMVITQFGQEKWTETLRCARLESEPLLLPINDVEDADVMRILDGACQALNVTLEQAADAFGDYWVNVYAPRKYFVYFEGITSAKDFLLNMDKVHTYTTRMIENARPPKFEYEWEDDTTMIMKYISKRGLIKVFVGLVKGVGKHFHEDLNVQQVGDDKVRVVFNT